MHVVKIMQHDLSCYSYDWHQVSCDWQKREYQKINIITLVTFLRGLTSRKMGSFIARTRGHRVAIKTLLSLLNQSSELALTKGKLTVRAAGPSYIYIYIYIHKYRCKYRYKHKLTNTTTNTNQELYKEINSGSPPHIQHIQMFSFSNGLPLY